mgnify:FL=1
MKFNDADMIRLGQVLIVAGVSALMLPFGETTALLGLLLIGLGCAPIYPCIIHSTPELFGADRSQAIIGVQMAAAYVGILVMPPVFGLIADHITVSLFPLYLGVILFVMIMMHEALLKKKQASEMSLAEIEEA